MRVPVLSEQMTVRLPRVSTAGSCLMMALLCAMTAYRHISTAAVDWWLQ